MIKYRINTCDQINDELMIHFTQKCENRCFFCVDAKNQGVCHKRPEVDKMAQQVIDLKDKIKSITISGGEPLLFMDEVILFINKIRENASNLKINLITSFPSICWRQQDKLFQIIEMLDNLAFSPQHYKEEIADEIRGVKSKYNHQELYKILPHKEKMCVNINLNKPYLYLKDDVCNCIKHYNDLGFTTIRVAELFDTDDNFVSFEEIFGIKMKSPFAHGCKTNNFDITPWIPSFKGNLIVKRVCFLVCKQKHCSFSDLVKVCTRHWFKKPFAFGVVYEDGNVYPYWK